MAGGERSDQRQQAALDGRGLERGQQDHQRPLAAQRVDRADQTRQLVSASTGCSPAIASCMSSTTSRRWAPSAGCAPRGRRRPARPGRRAREPARRAAGRRPWPSPAGARRRPGPPRCAPCRAPARTRRSRSGCQVRTTTDRLRALARQSTLRTSSPATYSRSESNSVPWPRTRTAARPSSSRSLASRLGRCLHRRERRQHPQHPRHLDPALPTREPERPQGTHGDPVGRQVPATGRPQAAGQHLAATRCHVQPVPVAGGAGRGLPRVAHDPADRTAGRAGDLEGRSSRPRPAGPGRPGGVRRPGLCATARASTSTTTRSSTTSPSQVHAVAAAGRSSTGTRPSSTSSGTRQVIAISEAPAPSRARSPAPDSTSTPSSSASGRSAQPVGQGGVGQRLDVVGGDEVATVSQAHARLTRSSAVAPRGPTPRRRDGAAGWPGRCRRCRRRPRRRRAPTGHRGAGLDECSAPATALHPGRARGPAGRSPSA